MKFETLSVMAVRFKLLVPFVKRLLDEI